MKINLNDRVEFERRHNGPSESEVSSMLDTIGLKNIDDLINEAIPAPILKKKALNLPPSLNEFEYLNRMQKVADKNKVFRSFIGQGYYNCVVPTVIQRNIMENPGWYTAYTPYQAEIAQGRLEALINFQTMVIDLTGMEIANASLLDEGTAAAEAMSMLYGLRKGDKKSSNKFLVDEEVFPQTLDVLKTRALPFGIELEVVDLADADLSSPEIFGVFFQYPNNSGSVRDWSAIVSAAQENQVFTACASDLLALTLLTAPGEWGTDVVVGTSQRFGVPMGYGGPHAAFFATKEAYKRSIPGRIIGASKDAHGNDAYRMALQTREQHIKRERATSNICTSQVLLAVMAGMYAVYHGAKGLKQIGARTHGLAKETANTIAQYGFENQNTYFFDTLRIQLDSDQIVHLRKLSHKSEINFRYFDDGVGISFDESHTVNDANEVVKLFARLGNAFEAPIVEDFEVEYPSSLMRSTPYLEHPIFNQYHSEHELLRYMKRLENKDLSLVHSMISLGSCTMKLNATTEMIPVTWPEFANIHPFAPKEQAEGYGILINELHDWLVEITGFHSVSFQPNSGAQGEYAGLMVIKSYLEGTGQPNRNVALIPSSAHGTNPASAVMAGMRVVIVKCDENGNIDVDDLREKAEANKDVLAALLVTYPSTHGVFEEAIIEICNIIHENGGQVYMDGANMNAQVGLTSPGIIGADVCHLNLHKTFCIPHGGGGPGMGPIGVAEHLTPYLPGHTTEHNSNPAVSAAAYGSASILPISHGYIAMMGAGGLTNATKMAILNANYIAARLKEHYPVLYANDKGRNAHELIIDCRQFKKSGIEVEDLAKRLIDYGFHAPTVSFPVPGTMMIEPTESEVQEELDRFCDAMIAIRQEIQEVIDGIADAKDNPLKNAPHSYKVLVAEEWKYPYSREKAGFPAEYVRENKFWPAVSRVDSAYGDRNLVCSCLPLDVYEEQEEEVEA
ncbi:glycine dehydrogenase [Ekhidna lutea]|uniref:Glycine dehydrogenase (decarboxylating) n=1 Tax=Ekhidna lutea TaxID=447679 RepID=A0A239EKX0_EKHLU|nr:aminomethyl-transferring glycine dehydrogenase [Ekhidna lutea]SNS45267.1 glycine dehydrogenase [Ekhidna lutea]